MRRSPRNNRKSRYPMSDSLTNSMTPQISAAMTRRQFFRRSTAGVALGIPALATLLATDGFAADTATNAKNGGLVGLPHFPPKARRVIFLHQSGAPSQMELFDYKPNLVKLQGAELPDSVRMGQRITGMTSGQSSFPVAPSIFKFGQYGRSGAWISELLPYHTKIVDDITIIKSAYTEAINHDPAITFVQTGFQQPGRPSMGAWISYGLGSENQNLHDERGQVLILATQPIADPRSHTWAPGLLKAGLHKRDRRIMINGFCIGRLDDGDVIHDLCVIWKQLADPGTRPSVLPKLENRWRHRE